MSTQQAQIQAEEANVRTALGRVWTAVVVTLSGSALTETVYNGACQLRKIIGFTTTSAHQVAVLDSGSTAIHLNSAAAIVSGTIIDCGDVDITNSLVLHRDTASASGALTVVYSPLLSLETPPTESTSTTSGAGV